jgi:hypothetical protein
VKILPERILIKSSLEIDAKWNLPFDDLICDTERIGIDVKRI